MPVSPRRGRTERRNETLEDKRFRQHLEKEFEEFTPGGSLKTRAAKRDLEQDRELVNQRLRDHHLKKTRSAMRKAKEAKEAEARKREDREHGRQFVRDTKMRIDLTKELIEKMRKKELATLMEALPSALETLAVSRFFGTHVDGDEGVEAVAMASDVDPTSPRSPRAREGYSEERKAALLRKMPINYVLSQDGPSWSLSPRGDQGRITTAIGARHARRIDKILDGSNLNSRLPFDGVSGSMMSWNSC